MLPQIQNKQDVLGQDNQNNSIEPKDAKQLPEGEGPAYSVSAKKHQIDLEKSIHSDQVRLDFVDVTVEVPVKGGTKRILNKVSGYVKPGEILYIMGPSGGGKTTLLDFLCNRTKQTPENNVFLNKKKWTEKEFKKIARYCQQHPLLYEVLTVKETLDFAAGFFTKSAKLRNERVERVIELLGLVQQTNTKIGGMFYRGISGGQKQRVSVGEQLVANPSILFLDEPTSGLDSAASFQLMLNLREICRKTNISIISSIHQPSQRVFDMSDRLMILAGGKNFGGNTAYFGRTEKLEDHFAELGMVKSSKSSVAEWVIDEVNGDFGQPESIQTIISGFSKSKSYLEMQNEHSFVKESQEISEQKQNQLSKFKFSGDYQKSGFCFDLVRLFKRNFLNILKNPLIFFARLISYSIQSLILGTVWWGAGDEPKAGDVSDINGVLFFSSTFFTIMAISLLPNMIEDRQIMVKEKSNGCYNLMNFIISNFVTSLPVTFIITLVSSSIIFFMIGFDADDGAAFIKFVINLYLMQLAGEGLILIIAFIFDQLLICIVTVSMIMGSFMIMEGFFIKYDSIPDGWIWLYWGNFCTYGMKNFMMIIYDGLTIQADPSAIPPVLQDYPGEQVLDNYKMNDIDYGVNILILIGWLVLFRTIGGIYSYYKHTGKK